MESHVVKTDAVYKRLWFLWGYWRLFLRFSWILAIFLQFVRFCCMKVPNAWIKFFVAICSAFQHFPLGIKYFLTLLNPLFPRVPVLTVVKYGVKNASWPGAAVSAGPGAEAFFRERSYSISSNCWAVSMAARLSRILGSSYDFLRHIQQEQWIFPLDSRPAAPRAHAETNSSPPSWRRIVSLRWIARMRCLR